MPILTLTLSAQAQLKDPQTLAHELSALSTRLLHKRADVTSVVFHRLASTDWWIDGEVGEHVMMQLDIRITQGTNSEAEKAAFIEQAYALLSRHLVEGQTLHPTTYISVQELPATDWGYGGQTQQQRRMAQQRL